MKPSPSHQYIKALSIEFQKHANAKIAAKQKAYLRNQFEFYGIKTTHRREIQKPFLVKEFLPPKQDLEMIVKTLWQKPQREYHYFAQELAMKYSKKMDINDIALFEFMVTHQSWWDTVDAIATKLIGDYFKKFPQQRDRYIITWIMSEHLWLQRSAILFQLKYKNNLDTKFLSYVIHELLGSKEFFINKAIGWILRDYSRINPTWVRAFVEQTNLSNLSRKEALRLMK